ncbi:2Fe-2S iron-sulfur cluster-binding protein [Streptomyces sp. NPDC046939]|uniref:(2Fe-2S)-binding protein n=1 Tax=Streptomyces sp. NPDC046939 TaxID=3155376 RepID=UPI0033FA09B9
MTNEYHGPDPDAAPDADGWQPLPQGDYDSDATAFVQLPPDGFPDAPLAAPGHGYVPPQITVSPVTGAAATDPAATGVWVLPPELTGVAGAPYGAGPAPEPEPQPEPEPHQQPYGFAPGGDTGQWSIPVAEGELPDESGEYTTSSLASHWGDRTPPATLPGGAPAPWAAEPWARAAEPVAEEAVGEPEAAEPDPEPEAPVVPEPEPRSVAEAAPEPVAQDVPETANGAEPGPVAEPSPVAEAGPMLQSGPVVEPGGVTEPSPVAEADPVAQSVPVAEPGLVAEPASEAEPGPAAEPSSEAEPSPVAAPGDDAKAANSESAADAANAESATAEGTPADPTPVDPEPAAEPDAAPAPLHDDHPMTSYVLRVNGTDRPVTDAWIGESLLYVLRERLGLAGAKDGCSQGECGACNVQVDGRLVASCLVPAATTAGSEVRTVEGLAEDGRASDVQRALTACGAVQCGFCVPGMAMTVHDLLEGNPNPTDLEARQALCGNLCRCSGYRGVLDAVRQVADARQAAQQAAAETAETVDTAQGAGTGEAAERTAPDGPPLIPHQGGPASSEDIRDSWDGGRA